MTSWRQAGRCVAWFAAALAAMCIAYVTAHELGARIFADNPTCTTHYVRDVAGQVISATTTCDRS